MKRDGYYEFGHVDGMVTRAIVRLHQGKPTNVPEPVYRRAIYALNTPGYWWRRVNVPDMLPVALNPTTGDWYWDTTMPPPPRYE